MSLVDADPAIRTVGDWAEAVEEEVRQSTSVLTVRFAYDFEARIRQVARLHGVEILDKDESEVGCDFRVVTSDFGIIHFEVKTTLSLNGWTGSTHSEARGKAQNYALVSFELNLDYPISNTSMSLAGVISAVHISVLDDSVPFNWNGNASNSNSSTTGKVASSSYKAYSKSVVFGSVKKNRVWCKCIREDISARHNRIEVAAK